MSSKWLKRQALKLRGLALLLLCSVSVFAGQRCETKVSQPGALALAAQTAALTVHTLQTHDRPVALIARIGQNLRAHGLLYSHAGIVIREAKGWRVYHLLNQCGTDFGGLNKEGIVEFFSDDPLSYQAKLVFLKPELERKLLNAIVSHHGKAVFEPHYSVIARPYSNSRQNSTGWLLEVIGAAMGSARDSRDEARRELQLRAYQPDIIRIPYAKRIAGGLFQANAVFTDHSIGTRLSGKYPTSTVHSVFRFLRENDLIEAEETLTPLGAITIPGE